MDTTPGIAHALSRVRSTRTDSIRHEAVLPARAADSVPWPDWVHPRVRQGFLDRGVAELWRHQAEAAGLAHRRTHVVVSTGTASGKSVAFQVPALSASLTARGERGQRGATTLYLSPTKALAADQLAGLQLLNTGVRAATHDGDSTREERDWTRDHAEYVLTNPDMLHRSLLPGHARWAQFFGALSYVVVDECHHYRGVFGAHTAAILRRLRRVCAAYGADPTFVLASATVAEPATSAGLLTGLPVHAVTRDASPKGEMRLVLWEPPLVGQGGENGAPVRRATTYETADLLADLVVAGVRSLAFIRSRRGAEQTALRTCELLAEVDPTLADRVGSYRGGYLPEERRAIERALREGSLSGLCATSALELGIDVAGLDAVLIAGFPGTRVAMWQQFGRAGRAGQESLGILVARDDPLDTYLVHHPESLLGTPVEATVFDPTNRHILDAHLCAAAAEFPLTPNDLPLFGPTAADGVSELTASGLLRRRPQGWFWTDRRRPSDFTDIRSAGGQPVQLIDGPTGRVVGTVDAGAAHSTAHPGAVYTHLGETWLVESLDLTDSVAIMHRADLAYSTSAREVTDISIRATEESRNYGPGRLNFGSVEVTHQVVSFLKRRTPGGEVIAEEPLDLPARTLHTKSVWWTLPADVVAESLASHDVPGAAHAAEHCSIGLLPLFATCDRWDIGGVSTALHADTGQPTVFVYDGHPGGAGFARRGFETASQWLPATRTAIADCECLDGCPSCIQSPKCGNQNHPLSKEGAIRLLDLLLSNG